LLLLLSVVDHFKGFTVHCSVAVIFSAEACGAIPPASQCGFTSDGLFTDLKTV
jgi:hypothetical protein